jgi:hypothetical protein
MIWMFLLALCTGLPAAWARPINDNVESLRRNSDVIVIGHVLAVRETTEEATLPELMPPIPMLGVETTFRADTVLKGDLTNAVFVLHHYRLRDRSVILQNGPWLIKFKANTYRQYLMFLKRAPDGKYVPAGGQADAAVSLRRLLHQGETVSQAGSEEGPDQQALKRQAERIHESPDTPLALEFVSMETPYGVRRAAKVRAMNGTPKAIIRFSTTIVSFDQRGEVLEISGLGMMAAVGEAVVPACGEKDVLLDGGEDNYETARVRAVVTSATFDDGTVWQAK